MDLNFHPHDNGLPDLVPLFVIDIIQHFANM